MELFSLRDGMHVEEYQYEADTDDSPLAAVTEAVADATDVSPYDLPPIYEFIDPDTINSLVLHHENGKHDGVTLLSFTFAECTVVVEATGYIRVCIGQNQNQFDIASAHGGCSICPDYQRQLN